MGRAVVSAAGRDPCRQRVTLESTTYPGTTRGVLLPILATSGLRAGRDFFLAYAFLVRHSPLLVDTRNATRDVAQAREKIWKAWPGLFTNARSDPIHRGPGRVNASKTA